MTINYIKVNGYQGIYKNPLTGKYQARKKINGTIHKKTFNTLRDASNWFKYFNDLNSIEDAPEEEHSLLIIKTSTLLTVWLEMQNKHFPLIADSTKEIWLRRYILLKQLEHLPMGDITPSVISSWVETNVAYFKSDEYEQNQRGRAKRSNLDNELNLFVTIFNWYKQSETFEKESLHLTCPVKTKHKKMGFIRVRQTTERAISVEDAFHFFNYLKPPYRDLALFQYLTASRVGEVAGLQWTRINFERREIVIMETCYWDMSNKVFKSLNPFPKNKTPRPVYMTDDLYEILKRMEAHKIEGCNFVFHIEGRPLNYCTIQVNYREAQRKAKLPYSGTHILRHGMATLARKVGGGLDAVIAITGHKDLKLADHYSKNLGDLQKDVSIKIANHLSLNGYLKNRENPGNVVNLHQKKIQSSTVKSKKTSKL